MRDTHQTRLMDYLVKYGSITSLQAITDLGNTRLAATVCELRKKGHDIVTTMVPVPTRWGTTAEVAKYTLNTAMTND